MIHNYKSFIKIFENNRENKIEKQKEKIRKFLKYEPIIDFVFDKVVNKDSTKGLKYTIWFADKIAKFFIDILDTNINNWDINMDKSILTSDFFSKYLKSGIINVNISDENKELIKTKINNSFEHTQFLPGIVQTIVDWLKSPLRNDVETDLSKYKTLDEAFDIAETWHKSLKASGIISNETGSILMTFDDGYYWIDLKTSSDSNEADAMGHCGTTSYGTTLYSLRKNQSPHVTSAIGKGNIYQMKGRNNKKPIDKYHPYIVELLCYPNVSENVKIITEFDQLIKFDTREWNPTEDFHINDLTYDNIAKIAKNNSDLISQEGIGVKYKLFIHEYITMEDLIKGYSDLVIVDNKVHFILDEWADFDQSIFKENRSYREWQKEILDGSADWDDNGIEFDYNYHWNNLTNNALKHIFDYCVNSNIEIFNDVDETKNFKINKDNSELISDDILFKSPNDTNISLKRLLDKGEQDIDDIVYGCEDLYDLKDALDKASSRAQSYADESQAYDSIINAILDKIGKIIPSTDNKIHIDLNFDYINEIENQLDNKRKSILDTINNIYNTEYPDELQIECDPPYYGWNGHVSDEDLSEYVIDEINNK